MLSSTLPAAAPTPSPSLKCSIEQIEPATLSEVIPSSNTLDYDQNCLISLTEAEKIRLQRNGQYVDVRSDEEFRDFHIADSINIPKHLLKTKHFLKSENVVLIDNGRGKAGLVQTCIQLRKSGFDKVSVLNGGLYAWHKSDRPLAGDEQTATHLNRMTPSELFEERLYKEWLILDISSSGMQPELRKWFPGKISRVKPKSAKEQFVSISKIIAQHKKAGSDRNILVVSDSGKNYDSLSKKIEETDFEVLYLEGGLDAYGMFVKRQIAIWDELNKPKRSQSCRT